MELAIAEILLPTDLSPRSAVAARYAATLARRFHSRLTLLHVLPAISIAYMSRAGGTGLDRMLDDYKTQLNEKLDSFLAEELKEFKVRRVVVEGDPAERIIEYSRSNNIDMIVAETRGTGVFRRLILGSVTAKVLHDAPCPVFTGVHAEQVDMDKTWSLRRVLCAVDPASGDESAIGWAVKLAAACEARLSVVHAIPAPPFHLQNYAFETGLRRLLGEGDRERIVKLLEAAGGPAETGIYVQSGPISKVVLSIAQDTKADAIVIGHGSDSELPRRLHTNGYSIIRDSICPVISV
jgi:nucleotide-binding universal stress UspA family protein